MERLELSVRDIPVQLTGQDGNAFMVLGLCQRAFRKAYRAAEHDAATTQAEWELVKGEMTSGDYDHLLSTAMQYFEVS